MKIAKYFLEVAKEDLKSSKVLYKEKLYSNAIYHLQQSIEKAAKSWGMYRGILKEDDVTKIRHQPIKIYRPIAISAKKELERILKVVEQKPEFFKKGSYKILKRELYELTREIEKIERIMANPKNYVKENALDDRSIINELERIKKLEKSVENIDLKDLIEFLKNKRRYIKKRKIKKAIEEIISKWDVLSQILEHLTSEMIPLLMTDLRLIILSYITIGTAEKTRYPEKKHHPLKKYTSKNPLVKSYHNIIETLEYVLQKMEERIS